MKVIFNILIFLSIIFLSISCGDDSSSSIGASVCDNIDCSNHGACVVVSGKAVCSCEEGYFLSENTSCEPMPESCIGVLCGGHGTCSIDENGKAECNCFDGYDLKDLECVKNNCIDVDCGEHGECINAESLRDITCNCESGYYLEDMKCVKNNCIDVNCKEHSKCVDDGIDATCVCDEGYYLSGDDCLKDNCINVDCGENKECINNSDGTFECKCLDDYYLEEGECLLDNCIGVDCGSHSNCVNNHGINSKCICDEGYILYEGNCVENLPTCIIESVNGENSPFQTTPNSDLGLISKSYYLNPENTDNLIYSWRMVELPIDDNNNINWISYPQYDNENLVNTDKHYARVYTPFITDNTSRYLIELKVSSVDGLSSVCSAEIKSVNNEVGIYIELFWDKPDNDMDLHFMNPENQNLDINDINFDENLAIWRELTNKDWWSIGTEGVDERDCHYRNCKNDGIEWGDVGNDDNPVLVRDDIPGVGPEIIILPKPQEGWYRSSVHFYRKDENTDFVSATLRVYCNGNLEYSNTLTLRGTNYTWLVNDIYWEELDDESGFCHIFDTGMIFDEKQGNNTENEHVDGYRGNLVYNASCSDGYTGMSCDICQFDYHVDENDNCIPNEVCDELACTEGNKNKCDVVNGVVECSCWDNYHEESAGSNICILNESCEADTCTEEHKTTCTIEDFIAVCSCDYSYGGENCEICGYDTLEPNSWTPFVGMEITNNLYEDLKLCTENDDVYILNLTENDVLNIDLIFLDVEGNIDIELYKEDNLNLKLAESISRTDNENLNYSVTESGVYVLRVRHAWETNTVGQSYSMNISGITE